MRARVPCLYTAVVIDLVWAGHLFFHGLSRAAGRGFLSVGTRLYSTGVLRTGVRDCTRRELYTQ